LNRKPALRRIIPKGSPSVLYADFVEQGGLALFRAACERDLEGIVAKQKDAPYSESVRWVKIRRLHKEIGRRLMTRPL